MTGLKTFLDSLLEAGVTRGDVPGVAAMATSGAETLYQGAFGERELGGGVAMGLDSVIAIASMTKAVTATAAMQLVEKGKLLTHTAGFGYEIWNQEILDFQAATGSPSTRTRTLASLKTPLLFDPGTKWNYGVNIDWAGQMVEAVSGQRLGAYMQDNIFSPLGMASSGFRAGLEMKARHATVHLRGDDGRLTVPKSDASMPASDIDTGGGGLLSSIEDYGKFIRMFLNKGACDGDQILRPETVAMMSVNQMGDCRVEPMLTTTAALSNDVEFFPGVEKAWGLSFMINLGTAPTGRSTGSLAWAGLTNAYYWIDPAQDVAGVYATQIFPFADTLSLSLFLDFETAVYNNLS